MIHRLAADTCVALATANIADIMAFTEENSL